MMCNICHREYSSASMGGPGVCPACDCGVHPDTVGLRIAEARIRELEAALRARGHTDICVTRVRGNFPCDCGLEAALSPATIPFTDKPGGSLPWKCSKCGDLNSSWQTFCSKCAHQTCSAPSDTADPAPGDTAQDREGEQ